MANGQSHTDRYFIKLALGFIFIISSVFIGFFYFFEAPNEGKWYFWATIASFFLCFGLYLLLQAVVHKVKSDFSRRAKQRDAHQSRAYDE